MYYPSLQKRGPTTTEGDHLLQIDIEVFGPEGPNISKYSDRGELFLGGSIFFRDRGPTSPCLVDAMLHPLPV